MSEIRYDFFEDRECGKNRNNSIHGISNADPKPEPNVSIIHPFLRVPVQK